MKECGVAFPVDLPTDGLQKCVQSAVIFVTRNCLFALGIHRKEGWTSVS